MTGVKARPRTPGVRDSRLMSIVDQTRLSYHGNPLNEGEGRMPAMMRTLWIRVYCGASHTPVEISSFNSDSNVHDLLLIGKDSTPDLLLLPFVNFKFFNIAITDVENLDSRISKL